MSLAMTAVTVRELQAVTDAAPAGCAPGARRFCAIRSYLSAAAAVAALQAHPRVAADLIMNSCPAVPFAESEVFALTRAGVEPGAAAALLRQLATAARTGRHQQTLVFPGAGHRLQVTAGFAPDT